MCDDNTFLDEIYSLRQKKRRISKAKVVIGEYIHKSRQRKSKGFGNEQVVQEDEHEAPEGKQY